MGEDTRIVRFMVTGGHADTITECRLYAAPGMLSRVIHMEHAPGLIHVHDDDTGLESVYRLTGEWGNVSTYLMSHLA